MWLMDRDIARLKSALLKDLFKTLSGEIVHLADELVEHIEVSVSREFKTTGLNTDKV